jgi:hypothetical protein
VREAKKKGVLIVGCPILFEPDYRDLGQEFGIKANVKRLGCFRKAVSVFIIIRSVCVHCLKAYKVF